MGIFFIFSTVFCVFTSLAAPHGISAQRPPQVSWKTLAHEYKPRETKGTRESAIDTKVPLPELDINEIPQLTDYAAVKKAFETARDTQFLPDPDYVYLTRRSTWLYPDDGCYARSALAIMNLRKNLGITPMTIFAYGNLQVKTPNAYGGSVTWWYHVAPIVGAEGEAYVLDPAIEPKYPLPLKEWASKLGGRWGTEFSVCDSKTYQPYSSCHQPPQYENINAMDDQMSFLRPERERILDLGRNPDEELGEHPPWML